MPISIARPLILRKSKVFTGDSVALDVRWLRLLTGHLGIAVYVTVG